MTLEIGEPVLVIAEFGGKSRLKPLRFRWSGKEVGVERITYEWRTFRGKSRLLHFSVTDGGTLYELSFDSSTLIWRIENVETSL